MVWVLLPRVKCDRPVAGWRARGPVGIGGLVRVGKDSMIMSLVVVVKKYSGRFWRILTSSGIFFAVMTDFVLGSLD